MFFAEKRGEKKNFVVAKILLNFFSPFPLKSIYSLSWRMEQKSSDTGMLYEDQERARKKDEKILINNSSSLDQELFYCAASAASTNC
jgi:hypothetical protein